MAQRLSGQVALVTGASRGIGEAIAIRLAKEGCHLLLMARSEAKLEALATRCESENVRVRTYGVDVTCRQAVEQSIRLGVEAMGGLDIVVNNAGIYANESAERFDVDAFEQVMKVNVMGLMMVTRFALPYVLKRPRGAVINIASVASRMGFAGGSAYCASKHAVMGYTESLFEDVREAGVKVSAICPGFVNTNMVAGRGLNHEKMIQPEDIAEAVVFVASYPDTGCPVEIKIRPQRVPRF
jgi:3-oxoacyl-[acyl-carrier protein] reductase